MEFRKKNSARIVGMVKTDSLRKEELPGRTKKKRLLVVVVLAVVLVALLARPVVNLVIEWLDPGQAPLNVYLN